MFIKKKKKMNKTASAKYLKSFRSLKTRDGNQYTDCLCKNILCYKCALCGRYSDEFALYSSCVKKLLDAGKPVLFCDKTHPSGCSHQNAEFMKRSRKMTMYDRKCRVVHLESQTYGDPVSVKCKISIKQLYPNTVCSVSIEIVVPPLHKPFIEMQRVEGDEPFDCAFLRVLCPEF